MSNPLLKRRVQAFELDADINGGKAPIDRDRICIAVLLPGIHLVLQLLLRGNTTGGALAGRGGEFNLGHVESSRS
jgi:hypothetical protein